MRNISKFLIKYILQVRVVTLSKYVCKTHIKYEVKKKVNIYSIDIKITPRNEIGDQTCHFSGTRPGQDL